MRKLSAAFILAILTCASVGNAQTSPPRPEPAANPAATDKADSSGVQSGVFGEVVNINAASRLLSIKTDEGKIYQVMMADKALYRRIPPGEKLLSKAVKIELADIGLGDRVYAQGRVAADQTTLSSRQLIVMTRADLVKNQEQQRAEWLRRGIAGVITALNPATKEISLQTRTQGGPPTLVIKAGDASVQFRRYAPDSVKFSDARPSSFDELKEGDQVRALGERSADGTYFIPEQVVTGSFRMIGGIVTAISPEAHEIKVNDIQTRQALTVVVNKDTLVRRLEPSQVAIFTQKPGGGTPAGANGQTPQGKEAQEILEQQPQLALTELKQGDMLLISSTKGADPTRVTAITVVAGMDAFLKQFKGGPPAPGGGPSANTGLPINIPLP